MTDWTDNLNDDERANFDEWVEHVRRDTVQKMSESAFVASLVPSKDNVDVKFAVELGLAIMLDKPILAIAMPGAEIPERLRRVADQIVEADLDVEEGRAKVGAALSSMLRNS